MVLTTACPTVYVVLLYKKNKASISKTKETTATMSSIATKAQDLHNAHDAEGMKSIATPESKFVFGDNQSMDWVQYCDTCKDVFDSFPDLNFAWSPEMTEENGGTKFVSTVTASGTHTGAPFGVGPHPKIEATGIRCQNETNEIVEWTVEDGKIKEMKVINPTGSLKTGPLGFYVQIGGKLE